MALGMVFIINPPVAAVNNGITNILNSMGGSSKVLLGLVLGGMMAADMGGPINKAAYVFGTASIASGNYDIMAAVMIGGMVPPLAIALATLFLKIVSLKRNKVQQLLILLWDFHLLRKEQYLLQLVILCIFYQRVLQVQQLLGHCQWLLDVH